jgi:hypothetical protein
MLTATGRSGRVQIGVSKDPQRELQAHAWVEHEGQTLLSTPIEVSRYTCLFTLEAASVPSQVTRAS